MPDELKQTHTYTFGELLPLAAAGGDRNRAEVTRRIEAMTPQERAVLRDAIQRLDAALDEVVIGARLRRIEGRKGGE